MAGGRTKGWAGSWHGAPVAKVQGDRFRQLASQYRHAARSDALSAREARRASIYEEHARSARLNRKMASYYAGRARVADAA